jgi:hypothetical protein
MKKHLFFLFVLLSSGLIINATVPERVGWWKFDNPEDLLKATIGVALELTGEQSSVDGPAAGNLATQVPLGSYLTMTHGIEPNGGGELVNEWSLQIDFSVPEIDTWYAFFQTLDGDADLFIAKTEAPDIGRVPNAIGCGSTLYSTAIVSAETWYRLIVSVKNGESFKIFVDGDLWLDALIQDIDGRYGLGPTLGIFQDDDGDDGTINCSELAIWDVALTAPQAYELGDATTGMTGIPNLLGDNQNTDLEQNFPNPFAETTTFNYRLNETGNVSFRIFNANGQLIQTIEQGNMTTGDHQLVINADQLNNGLYYVQMKTGDKVSNRKMTVVK